MLVLAVFQMVGTATRESIPDVPMFTATPAKRPRRQSLSETLTEVGQSIANALTPEAVHAPGSETPVEQVCVCVYTYTFQTFHTISLSF